MVPPEIYKTLPGRSDHEWNRQDAVLVKEAAIKGIKEAKANLVPARMISGTGVSFANINRRAKHIDGTISLGLNPDGPADRQIGLLRFERMDGTTLAVVANYAMHGTVMSGRTSKSAATPPV